MSRRGRDWKKDRSKVGRNGPGEEGLGKLQEGLAQETKGWHRGEMDDPGGGRANPGEEGMTQGEGGLTQGMKG